jgi:asparagine synthase (glutamine-hydrolysing)
MPVTGGKVGTTYKARQFLTAPDGNPDRAHFWWRVVFPRADALSLLAPGARARAGEHDPWQTFERHAAEVPASEPLARAQYVDVKTFLADGILPKVDRATMAHALEARSPFLDHRLLELGLALPARAKVRGATQKVLLRRLMQGRLPATTLGQPKRGFNGPVSAWLRGPLREIAHDLLAPAALRDTGLFEPASVARLWAAHERGWQDQGLRLWTLFVFMVWWQAVGREAPGRA